MEEQEPKRLDDICGEGQIAGHEEDEPTTPNDFKPPQTEEEIMKPVDFKEGCFGMRSDIDLIKSKVQNWKSHPELVGIDSSLANKQRAEAYENLILAYHHLEDARMRIGKAIQAYDGGKSCYPR
jgi:hypothetical protein